MAAAKITRVYAKELVHRILDKGRSLSNVAFNNKYNENIPEDVRNMLKTKQEEWDEMIKSLPNWLFQ